MIAIISDDVNQSVGQRIYETMLGRGNDAEYISVSDKDVKPCYGCGGCTYKTYGKCVIRDDGDKIYPKLISADIMLIVTPVCWGTYSFRTKRVLDKLCVIGDRHYYIERGNLVKGIQGNIKKLCVIGIKDNCSTDEKMAFRGLVAENINIMNIKGDSFVVGSTVSDVNIAEIAEEICR